MEDKPAGKNTPNNPPIDSPSKRVHNPIGIESQWSLGWNNGGKDIFNRPNNSKGTPHTTQVSTPTTIRVASCWARANPAGKMTSPPKPPRRPPTTKNPSGTTTRKMQVKPQWCWVAINLTTAKRTRFTRRELPPLSPSAAKNDTAHLLYYIQITHSSTIPIKDLILITITARSTTIFSETSTSQHASLHSNALVTSA